MIRSLREECSVAPRRLPTQVHAPTKLERINQEH